LCKLLLFRILKFFLANVNSQSMVGERLVIVGSVTKCRICGSISEPGGTFRVTRGSKMVKTTRWVTHFLKEIAVELIAPIRKQQ